VLQRSAAGVAAVLVLALLYLVIAGVPQPTPPANSLFAPVSVQAVLTDSRPELSSFDFSARPVFALKRLPAVPPVIADVPEAGADEVAAEEAVGNIEGVTLVGIFGSGEVAGVIIRLDKGERQRLLMGESVEGWTLVSLGARRAMLEAGSGQQAVLEMAFATDQEQLPSVEPVSSSQSARSDAQRRNATSKVTEEASEAATEKQSKPRRMSFQGMYDDRYGSPSKGAEGQK
jgi:hypothetical protein